MQRKEAQVDKTHTLSPLFVPLLRERPYERIAMTDKTMDNADVIVIGGGLAGLTITSIYS
jgi:hypothetical protein